MTDPEYVDREMSKIHRIAGTYTGTKKKKKSKKSNDKSKNKSNPDGTRKSNEV